MANREIHLRKTHRSPRHLTPIIKRLQIQIASPFYYLSLAAINGFSGDASLKNEATKLPPVAIMHALQYHMGVKVVRIGVPTEIKANENRVGLTPASTRELVDRGHGVYIQSNAGNGAGFTDEDYIAAGGTVCAEADDIFDRAELIVKVKEPQIHECRKLRDDQILFTYLHLAADPAQANALLDSGVTAFSYETVTAPDGSLPLLTPMSRIAGRLAVQIGAYYLATPQGTSGLLIGGVPGVLPARVSVLGAGVAGTSAVEMAIGLEAHVTVLDNDIRKLERLSSRFGNRLSTVYATSQAVENEAARADVLIGAVLTPGAAAPKVLPKQAIYDMRPGSVIIDISIDQGGCFPTSKPTTHADPVYTVGNVIHYCVTNMPGSVPRTATVALNNATLPFVCAIAKDGWKRATTTDKHLANGLTVHAGKICHEIVARELGIDSRLAG